MTATDIDALRRDLQRLADEQAALRRVATLVAQGAPPADVFAAVAREVGELSKVQMVLMSRYEPDLTATVIGAWGDHPLRAGARWSLDGPSVSATVLLSGRTARIEEEPDGPGAIADVARELGVHSRVGVPIVVDGHLWGVIAAGAANRQTLPQGIEVRLAAFTELVAIAISNAQAREELRLLAEEQAALRRVATAVAQGNEPTAVFDAVCEETGRLMDATSVNLVRFTPDGLDLTIAGWSLRGNHVPPGTSYPLEGDVIDAIVQRTRAPARVDSYQGVAGALAATLRELGIKNEVAAPVLVAGEVWGALIASSDTPGRFDETSERRVAGFAELIATAVANAAGRAELIASRARIVTAGDAARRRLARDLHDGAQQRLVTALMSLQLADQRIAADPEAGTRLMREALDHTREGLAELRELAAGVHPSILTNRGLRAAVGALADLSPIPVEVDVPAGRYPAHLEAAAYFLTAEALTNVAKHANATRASVRIAEDADRLSIEVSDDGIGGASLEGHGLRGLDDRANALGGSLHLESRRGEGTLIEATLPLSAPG